MFGPEREEVLESSQWIPTDDYDYRVAALEAWSPRSENARDSDAQETNSLRRHRLIDDEEIERWISHTARQRRPTSSGHGGSIRLLLCERRHWNPQNICFSMKESTFSSLEDSFRLPEETLPIIRMNGGQFFHRISHPNTPQCRLSLVVKLPQMYQLGNHGIALSHSFHTGTTSAFMHGWNLIRKHHELTSEPVIPVMERLEMLLLSSLASDADSFRDPLLLPTIILKDHSTQMDRFLTHDLIDKVENLERRLRVTKSARLAVNRRGSGSRPRDRRDDLDKLKKLMADEQQRTDLTTDLNTVLTDTLNFSTVIKWERRYCQFLLDVHDKLRKLSHGSSYPPPDEGLDSILNYLDCHIQSNTEYVETMVARLNLQLSVVCGISYNPKAQLEESWILTSCHSSTALQPSGANRDRPDLQDDPRSRPRQLGHEDFGFGDSRVPPADICSRQSDPYHLPNNQCGSHTNSRAAKLDPLQHEHVQLASLLVLFLGNEHPDRCSPILDILGHQRPPDCGHSPGVARMVAFSEEELRAQVSETRRWSNKRALVDDAIC